MKRLVSIITFILIAIFMKSGNMDHQKVTVNNYLKEMNMNGYMIRDYEEIKDFDNNSYLLYNFQPQGYAIFKANNLTFIEGSFASNSLYHAFSEPKYYIGPFNYYIKKDNNYYNLIDQKYYQESDLQLSSKNFNELINQKSNSFNNLSLDLPENNLKVGNWTYIENYEYFQKLYDFPDNVDGSCGFVALAMILGYLDTFYDDRIVSDEYLKQSSSEYSRGTKDELQYLLMEYGHYINIPFTDVTRAATARHMYDTFSQYRKDYIPVSAWKNSFVLYHEAPLLGKSIPTDEIKFLIDKGKPVMLIMRTYTYQKTEDGSNINNTWHDIIAYGYNGDKFMTHFGWDINGASQYILSSAIIQSYITIDYFK